jgi:SAM-dependent methyltransferase
VPQWASRATDQSHGGASGARYDGHADWYDEVFPVLDEERELIRRLVPPGEQRQCLDVACGTGRYTAVLESAGYHVIGADCSSDQLRVAATRCHALARCDVRRLALRTASFPLAFGAYFHTDVDDFVAAVAEVARCLEPGGTFVYIGLHPCFIGPFVARLDETEGKDLTFVSGYGQRAGWANRGSGGGTGLWARVGGHHKTLAVFLGAFGQAGLNIKEVVELPGGGVVLPRNIALLTTKPAA